MQIKTTLYDIIGYILPGGLFLLLLLIGHAQYDCDSQVLKSVWANIEMVKWPQIIVICFVLYIAGHIISSLSSLLESWTSKSPNYEKLLGSELFNRYKSKLEELYKCKPDSKSFRLCVCYVESKQSAVYSTAFTFLSFYGMSRNTSLLLALFAVWEMFILTCVIMTKGWSMLFSAVLGFVSALILTVLTYYTYKRFRRYFYQYIICGFLL